MPLPFRLFSVRLFSIIALNWQESNQGLRYMSKNLQRNLSSACLSNHLFTLSPNLSNMINPKLYYLLLNLKWMEKIIKLTDRGQLSLWLQHSWRKDKFLWPTLAIWPTRELQSKLKLLLKRANFLAKETVSPHRPKSSPIIMRYLRERRLHHIWLLLPKLPQRTTSTIIILSHTTLKPKTVLLLKTTIGKRASQLNWWDELIYLRH